MEGTPIQDKNIFGRYLKFAHSSTWMLIWPFKELTYLANNDYSYGWATANTSSGNVV
jgi:hypothetical protein